MEKAAIENVVVCGFHILPSQLTFSNLLFILDRCIIKLL